MPNSPIGAMQALVDPTETPTGPSISRNLVAGRAITPESTPHSAAPAGRRPGAARSRAAHRQQVE